MMIFDSFSPSRRSLLCATGLALASGGAGAAEVPSGGLVVSALWETKAGESDKVAGILARFLPQARAEPGIKLFMISRGKDNPDQFLFFELFADEAALAAHQASDHFKNLIVGEALPLLAKRDRMFYRLI